MGRAATIARLALVTVLGAGYVPKAPGTAGSLVALVLLAAFPQAPWYSWCLASAVLVASLGCVALGSFAERHFGRKDPEPFVLDEVAGLWLAAWSIGKPPLYWCIAAFALFRWLDVKKPFGIRRLQRLRGGIGIVADDLAAGLAACAIVHASRFLASHWSGA